MLRFRRVVTVLVAFVLLFSYGAFAFGYAIAEGEYEDENITDISPTYETIAPLFGGWPPSSPLVFGEGPWPGRNVEVRIRINQRYHLDTWLLAHQPSVMRTRLGNLPVMAGFFLERGWSGQRSTAAPPFIWTSGLTPSPVSISEGNMNTPSLSPSTSWLHQSYIPFSRYYPIYLYMGSYHDVTGWIAPSFRSVQIGMDNIHLNYGPMSVTATPPPPTSLTRAVTGNFTDTDFVGHVIVENLFSPLFETVGPLQFKLPYGGDFAFASTPQIPNSTLIFPANDYHIYTNFMGPAFCMHLWESVPGRYQIVTLPIIPSATLGAGTHSTVVTAYQRGYVYEYMGGGDYHFQWHNAFPLPDHRVHLFNGGPLLEHRNNFTVTFVVMRQAAGVTVHDPYSPHRNSTVHVYDYYHHDYVANYINKTLDYNISQADDMGLDHEFLPQSNAYGNYVRITVPPPRYTFFGDTQAELDNLVINPPPGYELVPVDCAIFPRTLVGNNLVFVIRPIHQ